MDLMGDTSLIEPGQCLSASAAAVIAVNLESSGQDSATEQGFDRTNKAIGAATHTFSWTGTNGDITIHGGAAAQAEVRRTVGQIDLFNVAARGKVGLPFKHLHHAGAALTDATAVVEVVETLVGVDAGIQSSLTQIRANLQASGLIKGPFPEISWLR